jgi:hypothetical protein
MKRTIIAVLAMALLTGCSGMQVTGDNAQNVALLTAIELAGYNAGYYVATKQPALDAQISMAYDLARSGKLTPEQMAQAFADLKIKDPQLAGSLMIVLTNMGATVGVDGGLVALSGIPVAYWDRAAQGYTMGFSMGKSNTKDINNVSAVKAKLPPRK